MTNRELVAILVDLDPDLQVVQHDGLPINIVAPKFGAIILEPGHKISKSGATGGD